MNRIFNRQIILNKNRLIGKGLKFSTEIVIIVISVSISMWFGNLSEDTKNEEIAQEFLKGIGRDLEHDLLEMKEDSLALQQQYLSANFILDLNDNKTISDDSIAHFLKKTNNIFWTTTLLVPNNGKYQGAKGAGHFRHIKNIELMNAITDLYEERIPLLLQAENDYLLYKHENLDNWDLRRNVRESVYAIQPRTFYQSNYIQKYSKHARGGILNILGQYHLTMSETRKILQMIYNNPE